MKLQLDTTVRDFLRTPAARWAIAFVVAAGALGLLVHYAPWRRSFDLHDWRNQEQIDAGERLEMADDLIARRQLDGMTRSEVVGLLGGPLPTGYFKDWDLVYWLGDERGLIGIDSEWLVVRFADQGRVAEYRIVTDRRPDTSSIMETHRKREQQPV